MPLFLPEVREMLAILADPAATESERELAAEALVMALAPDLMELGAKAIAAEAKLRRRIEVLELEVRELRAQIERLRTP